MPSADIDVSFDGYASLYSSPSQPGTFTLFCTEEITGKKLCLGSRHDLEPLLSANRSRRLFSHFSHIYILKKVRDVFGIQIFIFAIRQRPR